MQRIIRTSLLMFLLALVCALFCSCGGTTVYYDYREIENLVIIETIGIDSSPSGVTVTVCSGTALDKTAPRIIKATAPTIAQALDAIQHDPSASSPFYSHVDHVVIGEQAASEGVARYLDYIFRTTEIRFGANMFIVKGGNASELIETVSSDSVSVTEMLSSIEDTIGKTGKGVLFSCEEVSANIAENGSSVALAIERGGGDGMTAGPAGLAVLDEGSLTGFVPKELAHSASVLLGARSLGTITVESEFGGRTVLKYSYVSADVKPMFSDGEMSGLEITVTCRFNVEEAAEDIDLLDSETRRALAAAAASQELENVSAVVRLSQQMNTDFLGIKKHAAIKAPVKTAKMTVPWEEAYPSAAVEINVNAMLERTYDLSNPIDEGGGKLIEAHR